MTKGLKEKKSVGLRFHEEKEQINILSKSIFVATVRLCSCFTG